MSDKENACKYHNFFVNNSLAEYKIEVYAAGQYFKWQSTHIILVE